MDCNCTITELGAYSLMGVYICLLPLLFFTLTSSSCISTRCAFPCAITFSFCPTQFGEKFIGLLGQYWFKMTWEFALCNDWISPYWWVVGTWSVLFQFWGWCNSACGSMEKWWLRYFSHSFITDLGIPNVQFLCWFQQKDVSSGTQITKQKPEPELPPFKTGKQNRYTHNTGSNHQFWFQFINIEPEPG